MHLKLPSGWLDRGDTVEQLACIFAFWPRHDDAFTSDRVVGLALCNSCVANAVAISCATHHTPFLVRLSDHRESRLRDLCQGMTMLRHNVMSACVAG